MGKLIYSFTTSIDGYINDRNGNIDWAVPSTELHQCHNDRVRSTGTQFLGRRLYEVMRYWDTVDSSSDVSAVEQEFADIWKAIDKIVISSSLSTVESPRTRLERSFDPDAIGQLVRDAEHDVAIGGADLAAQALRAGLVDEIHQFLAPVIIGGGTPFLPDDIFLPLDLIDERRFDNGTVMVRYAVKR